MIYFKQKAVDAIPFDEAARNGVHSPIDERHGMHIRLNTTTD